MDRDRIDKLARIAQMFLNGDAFERVLIDQETHTNYRFDEFNELKSCLMKLERLEEDLDVCAVLWRLYPQNSYVAEPLIAASGLPKTGWRRTFAPEAMRRTYLHGEPGRVQHEGSCESRYYPLRNSDDDIVGVLEFLLGQGYRKDVDTAEMFMEPVTYPEDDE